MPIPTKTIIPTANDDRERMRTYRDGKFAREKEACQDDSKISNLLFSLHALRHSSIVSPLHIPTPPVIVNTVAQTSFLNYKIPEDGR